MITALAAEYPVRSLCAALELAPSVYYYQAPESADEVQLKAYIQDLAGRWPTYGYRRITVQLHREHQVTVNSKRVRRLMQELDIQGARPRRKKRTTNSDHAFPRYPNLVQDLTVERPDQVWVGDITYIHLADDFVYLAVLMDVFTRSIRGWHLGRSLEHTLTLTALQRALAHDCPEIHHSDQGLQYAATAYVEVLQQHQIAISMADVGAAWQNGYAERLMRTIKEEEVDLADYQDYADAYQQIQQFLEEVYMHKRIHSALGYLTPVEFATHYVHSGERQHVH